MRKRKQEGETSNDRRGPVRKERLLELLRSVRAPQPSPEYLADFWPRLRRKLAPRRPAILHPLYYGGLAAAAAALVLWVTLRGPVGPGRPGLQSPIYRLATAAAPDENGERPISYVSGPHRREDPEPSPEIDYILPRSETGGTRFLEV